MIYKGYEITKVQTPGVGVHYEVGRGLVTTYHEKQKDAKEWVDFQIGVEVERMFAQRQQIERMNARIEALTGEPAHITTATSAGVVGLTLEDLEAIVTLAENLEADLIE